MTLVWDAGEDFSEVVDTLDEVTWKSSCSGAERVVRAWRFSESSFQSTEGGGAFSVFDSTWQVRPTSDGDEPVVGDKIVEVDGKCWAVVAVSRLRGNTRYRCEAKRVVPRRDKTEWIELQEAEWLPGPPPTISGWRTIGLPLRGHAELASSEADSEDATKVIETHRITLGEPVVATPNHRFRTHAGKIYRVQSEINQGNGPLLWSFLATLEDLQE